MKIPHFRGVFMRNGLPKSGPFKHESGIINLDDNDGSGTHWVAYKKSNNNVIYFDSFGDLQPPIEFISYAGVGSVNYNYKQYQTYDTVECGHLCLKFLCNQLDRKEKYFLYKHMP